LAQSPRTQPADGIDHATPKAILNWEEVMPALVGFGTFAALPEEQISEKISRRILSGEQEMLVWWSIGAGIHVEPHSHANEQIAWMLKGKMEFRLGSEQRVCGRGDVVWSFREVRSTRHGFAKTPR
jgi:quercetin dioxygenase-like cupin family protein